MNQNTLLVAGGLAAVLAVLAYRPAYRAAVSRPGSVSVPIPGETVTGSKTPVNIAVPLPAGAAGQTFLPIRNAKPNATVFLDAAYRAGYPDKFGNVTEKGCLGYWHTGVDMNGPGACSADQGDPLHAVRDGVVVFAGTGSGSWGWIVVLEVNVNGKTYWIRYGHVQHTGKTGATVKVKRGDVVKARQVIGFIGKGAWRCAHLHLDVFHTKPARWDWWPTFNGTQAEVTRYCTDPAAWFKALKAVNP